MYNLKEISNQWQCIVTFGFNTLKNPSMFGFRTMLTGNVDVAIHRANLLSAWSWSSLLQGWKKNSTDKYTLNLYLNYLLRVGPFQCLAEFELRLDCESIPVLFSFSLALSLLVVDKGAQQLVFLTQESERVPEQPLKHLVSLKELMSCIFK